MKDVNAVGTFGKIGIHGKYSSKKRSLFEDDRKINFGMPNMCMKLWKPTGPGVPMFYDSIVPTSDRRT